MGKPVGEYVFSTEIHARISAPVIFIDNPLRGMERKGYFLMTLITDSIGEPEIN
jgi:hypothetical protein